MISPVEKPRRAVTARTCILVLGMHRSGTSALSGVLSLLGCDQPKTPLSSSRGNEKGHFESQKIYELHRDLLKSAGTGWDDWTEFYSGWFSSSKADEFQERALSLLEDEFGASRLFVLKDPRICRMAPFWLETIEGFGAVPRIVLTHRNPLEVAASLSERNDFEVSFGLLLWLRHVLDAEAGTRGLSRYFTSYDALLDNWPGVMQGLQQTLGVSFPRMTDTVANEVEEFLTARLQHFREKAEKVTCNRRLSQWIRTTYVVMEKWAAIGEDSADHATLDKLRGEFNNAAPAFSRLVKDGQAVRKQVTDSSAALAAAQTQVAETETRLAELAGKETEEAAQRAVLEKTLAGMRDNLAKTKTSLIDREQELDHKAKALNASKATAAGLEQSLAEEQARRAATEAAIADLRISMTASSNLLTQRSLEAEEAIRQVAGLTDKLTNKQAQVVQLQQALADEQYNQVALAAALQEARDTEAQTRSALAQRSLEAEEVSRELQALQKASAAETSALRDRQRELEQQAAELAADLTEKTRECQSLRTQIDVASRDWAQKLATVQSDADELAPLREQITRAKADISQLEVDVATRFRELGELTRILVQKDHDLQKLQQVARDAANNYEQVLVQKDHELQKLQQVTRDAANNYERVLVQKDHELQKLQQVAHDATNNYHEILVSNSWRITAPLRRVVTLLRRIRG